jgi:hypothetical protein
MIDVKTKVEKINKDLAENEMKFVFKPSEAMRKSLVGYINYSFKITDDG